VSIECALPDEPGAIDAYLTWVIALLDQTMAHLATVPFAVPVPQRAGVANPHEIEVRAPGIWSVGWLSLFAGDAGHWFSHVALAEMSCGRAIPTRSGTLLVAGISPHRPPSPAEQDALARELARAMFATCRERLGFDPRTAIEAVLGPELAARGYTPSPHPDPYTVAFTKGLRGVRFRVERTARKLFARCFAEWVSDLAWQGNASCAVGHDQVFAEQATPLDAVARWAARLDELEPWFGERER
jgi:hypothetical protein